MSRPVPFSALLRSEWTKLRSVRATWWCSGLYLLAVGGTGWLAAASTDSSARAGIAVQTALTGFGFGQLLLVACYEVASLLGVKVALKHKHNTTRSLRKR